MSFSGHCCFLSSFYPYVVQSGLSLFLLFILVLFFLFFFLLLFFFC
jgi:hypothetical protein